MDRRLPAWLSRSSGDPNPQNRVDRTHGELHHDHNTDRRLERLEYGAMSSISPRQCGAGRPACNADRASDLTLFQISILPASSYWRRQTISNQPLYSKRHLMDRNRISFQICCAWQAMACTSFTGIARTGPSSGLTTPELAKSISLVTMREPISTSPAIPAVPLRKSRTKVEYVQPSPTISPDCKAVEPLHRVWTDCF